MVQEKASYEFHPRGGSMLSSLPSQEPQIRRKKKQRRLGREADPMATHPWEMEAVHMYVVMSRQRQYMYAYIGGCSVECRDWVTRVEGAMVGGLL